MSMQPGADGTMMAERDSLRAAAATYATQLDSLKVSLVSMTHERDAALTVCKKHNTIPC